MSGPPWVLATATGRYAVGFAPDGLGPVLQDWGSGPVRELTPARRHSFLTPADLVPLELAALGTRQVRGSDLVVDHGDSLVGARLVWALEDVELVTGVGSASPLAVAPPASDAAGSCSRLTARAVDTTGDLEVVLTVETCADHDVVTKWATYRNTGERPLTLPRAFSPAWELPVGPGATVQHLAGEWAREFTPCTTVLTAGELSIGSRSGITSHHHSPTVVLTGADDPDGAAYGIALAWSGSWRLLVEVPPFAARVRVAGGVDDESCVVTLEPGETFATPATLGVHAPDGPAGVQRRWHDHQRGWLARDLTPAHRPVVYNSWYATEFDVRLEHQQALADVAAELGVEAFVVDDGWFRGRTSDRAGLGDWQPDTTKFPDGLGPLADAVLARGMRFGLWVEPEAVNPDSDLYRAHPDWVYRAGDRPLVPVRNQYVLDLGRPEVVAWIEDWLRELLADGRVSYLKWDMNRPVSDGGRPGDPHGRQWTVQHATGYHEILRMLRDEFPAVTVEACSGGGGRVDAAVLARTDVVWTSDETGARDRLAIQHGFLSAYGPHVLSSWVTDLPSRLDTEPVSLEFRFVVAMAGVLGIGADLLRWDDGQRQRARELVGLYRDIRQTVHTGQVERHGRPQEPVYAVEYGTAEQTVVLVHGRSSRPAEVRLVPRTLRPDRRYRLRGRDAALTPDERASGVVVPFTLADDADVLVFEPVP